MSGKLSVKQYFGVTIGPGVGLAPSSLLIRNGISFCGPLQLIYPSGHNVAVLNIESKEQSFISATHSYQHNSLGISALECSLMKKIIAVAEKVEPTAIITIYDSGTLRKKKLLSTSEFGSSEVKCLAFSEDGKFFLTQGGGPEWNLTIWNIEKVVKTMSSVKISLSDDCPVNKVGFNPWDSSVIIAIGKSIFRLFRYVEGQFRPITCVIRKDSANIISFCWLAEDILLLGTDAGEILLIDNYEYRGLVYPTPDSVPPEEGYGAINCIAPITRGFVIGTTNEEIKIFEHNENIKERYQIEDTLKISGNRGSAIQFALGNEEVLVCTTDKNQILSIPLSVLSNVKEHNGVFENVLTSFHMPNSKGEAAIVGIDVALWKQIVVTCGKDRTVRVWNPSEKKMDLMRSFEEEPISLSVHPSGVYVAVAFIDTIRIFSLLLEEIADVREISARGVNFIKYSKGGQYIASANGAVMQIYSAVNGSPVCSLRGHNNRIKSCVWMNFDSRLMTVGVEGTVYFWELFPTTAGLHRRPENFSGNVPFHSGTGPSDGTKVFVCTTDRIMKELTFISTTTTTIPVNAEGSVIPTKEFEIPYNISNMIYDETRKMILMATSNNEDTIPGSILCALASPQMSSTYDTNPFHSVAISAIVQSYDGSTIYTGDLNGNLCISEFDNSFSGKQQKKGGEGLVSFEFVDEVVIQKSDLDARRQQIGQLTLRVEELNSNNNHQLRLKELEFRDKITELTDKFSKQLDTEQVKFEDLETEKSQVEYDYTTKMKNLEKKQIEELKQLEFKYKTKQNAEDLRYKSLLDETDIAHRRWNEENQLLVESHQKFIQELTLEYEDKFLAEQVGVKDVGMEREGLNVYYDGYKNETEMDGDKEVAEMKIKYESKLKQEEDLGFELMGQHAIMKKNLQMLNKESIQQKEEIKRIKDKENRLHETISSLEKDIQSHKKEIREREETISDKEKRIFDLKKKNQELEKFRFVLDYKIKELKLQIAPREIEIATMSRQIEEMGLEIEQYNRSNMSLNLMVDELKLKMDGVKQELLNQTNRLNKNKFFIERFNRDLLDTWETRGEKEAFKSSVVKMYRSYVQDDDSHSGSNNKNDLENPEEMYNRDREQLERSLDSLRRATKTEAVSNKRDQVKMMREGVLLTNELNLLRKNARYMMLQKKAIQQLGNISLHTDLTEIMEMLSIQSKAKPSTPKPTNNDNFNDLGTPRGAKQSEALPPNPPANNNNSKREKATSRSAALKTTLADGRLAEKPGGSPNKGKSSASKSDQWEAWREIQMQYDQMKLYENQLSLLCDSLNIDVNQIINDIDADYL